MLSRHEGRALADIERRLSLSDPALARRLRSSASGCASGGHLWLLVAWGLLGMVLLVAGSAASSTVVAVFGGVSAITAAVAYGRHSPKRMPQRGGPRIR